MLRRDVTTDSSCLIELTTWIYGGKAALMSLRLQIYNYSKAPPSPPPACKQEWRKKELLISGGKKKNRTQPSVEMLFHVNCKSTGQYKMPQKYKIKAVVFLWFFSIQWK